MVSPAEFIPVTEETGLIIPLGRSARYEDAIDATLRLLTHAEYAGTSLLERCLYLERCRDVMLRRLRDHRIPAAELLDARRLGVRHGQLAVTDRAA